MIMCDTKDNKIEDIDWTDYPYIGIGKKPHGNKYLSEDDLEKIIGG